MTLLFESFVFGAVNSIHCACMCGPLALTFQSGTRSAIAYQLTRAISYTVIGAALGGIGTALGSRQLASPTAYVAFVLAAGLIVLATVGERGAIKIPGLNQLLQRAMSRSRGWSANRRAALLGAFTPLLPCGLLWAALAGAAVAGSPFDGGQVMLGFAAGSLPLLLIAQTQATMLAHRLGPNAMRWVQRTAMLTAAGMLIWRGVVALQGESCCH